MEEEFCDYEEWGWRLSIRRLRSNSNDSNENVDNMR